MMIRRGIERWIDMSKVREAKNAYFKDSSC